MNYDGILTPDEMRALYYDDRSTAYGLAVQARKKGMTNAYASMNDYPLAKLIMDSDFVDEHAYTAEDILRMWKEQGVLLRDFSTPAFNSGRIEKQLRRTKLLTLL